MDQKINDKLGMIRDGLRTSGFEAAEHKGGIRIKSNLGYIIDIYTLKNSPDHIRARIQIREQDPLKRQAHVESIRNSLVRALTGIVFVAPFHASREIEGVHVYNSALELADEYFDPDPIEICEDAIEICDDAIEIIDADDDMPVDILTDDPADSDAMGFSLDFGLKGDSGDSRLIVSRSLAEEAIDVLETVDAKVLRQTLDMMNLKRSSAIRLAVTRIFRSATDVGELEKTIQNEAGKIVSPEDRSELEAVKALSVNGFLNPVVQLLWQAVFQAES